ncbi:hypothetical protein FBZ84_101159 [Azospirillum baldaniorum]|uniref:hypothetical protein n=1 Tax=Azospirillum baldaniorum TaxID=1064539 RepID=UPI00119DD07E|nr:hypothetical protein [Azospirillum baldaniorum]TWA71893.1 hypothetical protein FBZ84_101159 [Azospirillum baldaniorum]
MTNGKRSYPPCTPLDLENMAHWVGKNLHGYRPDTAENAAAACPNLVGILRSAAEQLSGRLHPDQECALSGYWMHFNGEWHRSPKVGAFE